MIALVWQFEVKSGRNDEFEALYGADGPWTALSRRSRSFLGSSFMRDLAHVEPLSRHRVWSEMVVYERHHADFEDEVQALEQPAGVLVDSGMPLGLFNTLDVPDRAGPTWSQRSGRSD